jgi:hypothetical protein
MCGEGVRAGSEGRGIRAAEADRGREEAFRPMFGGGNVARNYATVLQEAIQPL